MTRLLDIGLERIKNVIMDMAHLSEASVNASIGFLPKRDYGAVPNL